MISAIIFSRDRANQLSLLLRSIDKNGSDLFGITVIYNASSDAFQDGYNILKGQHEEIVWIKQQSPPSDFREITLQAIKNSEEYICFFVDDNILYRKVDTIFESIDAMFRYFDTQEKQLLCLSLRLGSNTSIQNEYKNTECPFPQELIAVDNLYALWDWTLLPKHTNFAYPFSVDGHIYRRDQVLEMVTYDFDTPNGLEGSGEFDVSLPNLMACFDESVLVNSPANIVGSSANKAGEKYGMELEELNRLFLSGHAIDLDSMDFSEVRGCHQEIQYQFRGEIKC
jgi:hypothetical protein|tara:strand:- start:4488 stop:5336 length:849 start_codon:yes stop_codon:yes gene_type:complete